MELLMELITELLLEGSLEVAKSRRISKWIRYPAIALLAVLYVAVVALIALTAWIVCRGEGPLWLGVGLLLLDIFFVLYSIRKIRKEILARKKEE